MRRALPVALLVMLAACAPSGDEADHQGADTDAATATAPGNADHDGADSDAGAHAHADQVPAAGANAVAADADATVADPDTAMHAHGEPGHMEEEHGTTGFVSAATLFAGELFGANTGDYGVSFAPDGDTLYFTRAMPGALTEAIVVSRRDGDGWSEPEVAPFSGTFQDNEPYVSPDGRRVYFASKRPLGGRRAKPDFDIWYVERDGAGWGEPVNLGAVNTAAGEGYPAVAADGTLVFARQDANDDFDLFLADAANGRDLAPRELPYPISTVYPDADPWIAADGSFFVFSSSRLFENAQGQGDIWLVRRDGDGWSDPVNLGMHVNNVGHEYGPAFSADGATFYFSRGFGGQVWMVPAELLEELPRRP